MCTLYCLLCSRSGCDQKKNLVCKTRERWLEPQRFHTITPANLLRKQYLAHETSDKPCMLGNRNESLWFQGAKRTNSSKWTSLTHGSKTPGNIDNRDRIWSPLYYLCTWSSQDKQHIGPTQAQLLHKTSLVSRSRPFRRRKATLNPS